MPVLGIKHTASCFCGQHFTTEPPSQPQPLFSFEAISVKRNEMYVKHFPWETETANGELLTSLGCTVSLAQRERSQGRERGEREERRRKGGNRGRKEGGNGVGRERGKETHRERYR